jgi:hypothetical protein
VLNYSSLLGGSSDDFGYAIALDAPGNIYPTDGTASADFPISSCALPSTYKGADSNTQAVHRDLLVTKPDPAMNLASNKIGSDRNTERAVPA